MANRRECVVVGLVVILLIAAVLFTHMVEVYRQESPVQQELLRYGALGGCVAIIGLVIFGVILWLFGLIRFPQRNNHE